MLLHRPVAVLPQGRRWQGRSGPRAQGCRWWPACGQTATTARAVGRAGDGTRAARNRNNGESAMVKPVSIDSVREPAHGNRCMQDVRSGGRRPGGARAAPRRAAQALVIALGRRPCIADRRDALRRRSSSLLSDWRARWPAGRRFASGRRAGAPLRAGGPALRVGPAGRGNGARRLGRSEGSG